MKTHIFFIIILFSLFSCDKSTTVVINENIQLEFTYLNGQVKELSQRTYLVSQKFGKIEKGKLANQAIFAPPTYNRTLTFDENGNLIKRNYNVNNTRWLTEKYSYEKDRLSERIVFNEEGTKLEAKFLYDYSKVDQVVIKLLNSNDYEFRRIINSIGADNLIHETNQYFSSNGKLDQKISYLYDQNKFIKKILWEDQQRSGSTYEFDENGLIEKMCYMISDIDKCFSFRHIEFDRMQNPLITYVVNTDGKVVRIIESEIEYH